MPDCAAADAHSRVVQVATEKERVRCIDDRVLQARQRIERLAGNTNKAIQVFASSTYPVPSSG